MPALGFNRHGRFDMSKEHKCKGTCQKDFADKAKKDGGHHHHHKHAANDSCPHHAKKDAAAPKTPEAPKP